jgi:hypothetical protein
MHKNRNLIRVGVAAGFFLLTVFPGLTQAASGLTGGEIPPAQPPALTTQGLVNPARTRHTSTPVSRSKKASSAEDPLDGITLTDDQKASIQRIHQDTKSRMDTVAQDAGSAGWQKSAMIEGLQRMERRQVFQTLTPQQQGQIREKALAERAAEQQKKEKQSQVLTK